MEVRISASRSQGVSTHKRQKPRSTGEGLIFRANGISSRENGLIIRANGIRSCENELIIHANEIRSFVRTDC